MPSGSLVAPTILQSTAAVRAESQGERRAIQFTIVIVVISLALQRFSVPLAGRVLSIVGPLGFMFVALGLFNGALSIHRARLVAFLALVGFILVGAMLQASRATPFGNGAGVNSLLLFLVLTSFAVFSFTSAVEESKFLQIFTTGFMVIGVAGIVQFFAQFVGLGLFAFSGFLPESILMEPFYNLQIAVGIGDLLKSNGFLLIEPSVFSQTMAIALIIEALAQRRARYLAVFVTGLLLSFSGTGWIILASFLAGSMIGLGVTGLIVAGGVTALLGTFMGLVALLSPDVMAALLSRLDEFNHPGSSGHIRFVTPFWMLSDVFSNNPLAILFGIGGGQSENLILPYAYAVNTPVKVMVEYGVPALVAYVLLFILGRKTRIQAALVVPVVVMFLFTGAYQEFPPMIFLSLMLTSVGRLRNAGDDASRSVSLPPAAAGSDADAPA